MLIGSFRHIDGTFVGRIRTLSLDADITIVAAAPSDVESAPAWRVLLGTPEDGVEVGAAWDRNGERAGAYLALQIDDPMFASPLRANLVRAVQDPSEHLLLWSRPQPRDRSGSSA